MDPGTILAFLNIANSLLAPATKQPSPGSPGVAGTDGGSSTDPGSSSTDTPPVASDPQSSDPLAGSPVQNYGSVGVSPKIPAPSQPGIPGSASGGGSGGNSSPFGNLLNIGKEITSHIFPGVSEFAGSAWDKVTSWI